MHLVLLNARFVYSLKSEQILPKSCDTKISFLTKFSETFRNRISIMWLQESPLWHIFETVQVIRRCKSVVLTELEVRWEGQKNQISGMLCASFHAAMLTVPACRGRDRWMDLCVCVLHYRTIAASCSISVSVVTQSSHCSNNHRLSRGRCLGVGKL